MALSLSVSPTSPRWRSRRAVRWRARGPRLRGRCRCPRRRRQRRSPKGIRRALCPARASASDDDSQARRGTSASTSKQQRQPSPRSVPLLRSSNTNPKRGDVAGELVVVAADDDDLFFVFNEKEIQGVLRARRLARAHRPHDRGKHEEGQGTETEGERERRAWEEAGGNSRRLALPIAGSSKLKATLAQRRRRGLRRFPRFSSPFILSCSSLLFLRPPSLKKKKTATEDRLGPHRAGTHRDDCRGLL